MSKKSIKTMDITPTHEGYKHLKHLTEKSLDDYQQILSDLEYLEKLFLRDIDLGERDKELKELLDDMICMKQSAILKSIDVLERTKAEFERCGY